MDLNHRPLGYEPNELPDCSTPHFDHSVCCICGQTVSEVNSIGGSNLAAVGWRRLFECIEVASTFWQRFNAPGNFSQHTNVDEAPDLDAYAIWQVNASRA